MHPSEHSYVERSWLSHDGLRLYARDYAPASGAAHCPVICIHGLTRNAADFEDLAPWLASCGRRVLAVDLRGRGRSAYDPDPSHYTPLVYARDIAALAHSLGIARAVFIGTSLGGIVTMLLCLRHSALVAAAVLNDVGPAISQRGLDRIAGYAGKGQPVASWDEAADYIRRINAVAFPGNTMDDWMVWARRTFAEDAAGRLVLQYDPGIAQPIARRKPKTSSLIAQFAFRRLARKRPTLLIRGALSDIIEAEQANRMRAAAPAMQYAEVSGVGHAPLLMEAEAREAIARFLATAP
ncbi:MAG: alpha/beta hydrolase [Pseudomonadota bacterium]